MNIKTAIAALTLAIIPSITFGTGEFKSAINQNDTLVTTVTTLKQQDSHNELMSIPAIEMTSQGEVDTHTFIVPGNVQITILGVCDQNCGGFGIKAIDENNGMDGSNFAAVRGNSNGVSPLSTMHYCTSPWCAYGIVLCFVQCPNYKSTSF